MMLVFRVVEELLVHDLELFLLRRGIACCVYVAIKVHHSNGVVLQLFVVVFVWYQLIEKVIVPDVGARE
jgi:hypothetical protein